jgi:hypothetical protein
MPDRPSAPLLEFLRKTAQQKGLNTAALAAAAEIPRGRMKHILSGAEPMLVDELIRVTTALQIDATAMAGGAAADPEAPAAEGGEADAPPALRSLRRTEAPPFQIDPLGNHAEQMLQLGLALGVDIFLTLHAAQLNESGIPRMVLSRNPEELHLRLDAAYHRHHNPTFLPTGLQVTLSFDALYTCLLPWAAFARVTLFPLPPDPPAAPPTEPEAAPDEDPPPPRRGHLRLV